MQGVSVWNSQSGLGIASLILSVISGIMIIATLAGVMFIIVQNPNIPEDDPQILVIGCGIMAGLLLAFVSGVLGLIGLFQPDRAKTCAVLGLVLAGLQVMGVGGLVLLGLLVS